MRPDLHDLLKLFDSARDLRAYEFVPAEELPPPYHGLLVHSHHMTVTVEKHYGSQVDVKVLDSSHQDDIYARKILLALQGSGKVVQFGLVRVRFEHVSQEVRDRIVAGKTPLGRVLIESNILRTITPTAFLRILPGPTMLEWFGMKKIATVHGRLAVINCDDQPAVEVLEIMAPA